MRTITYCIFSSSSSAHCFSARRRLEKVQFKTGKTRAFPSQWFREGFVSNWGKHSRGLVLRAGRLDSQTDPVALNMSPHFVLFTPWHSSLSRTFLYFSGLFFESLFFSKSKALKQYHIEFEHNHWDAKSSEQRPVDNGTNQLDVQLQTLVWAWNLALLDWLKNIPTYAMPAKESALTTASRSRFLYEARRHMALKPQWPIQTAIADGQSLESPAAVIKPHPQHRMSGHPAARRALQGPLSQGGNQSNDNKSEKDRKADTTGSYIHSLYWRAEIDYDWGFYLHLSTINHLHPHKRKEVANTHRKALSHSLQHGRIKLTKRILRWIKEHVPIGVPTHYTVVTK